MKKIGYIDEDAAEKNSFYHNMSEDFSVVFFDLTTQTQLAHLVDDIFAAELDMLVLDFRLDDVVNFNADELIEEIHQRNAHYPLIVLTSHEQEALDDVLDANLVNPKEDMLEDKLPIFKLKVSKLAENYRRQKEDSEQKLLDLVEIRKTRPLNAEEEDLYVELNTYIDKSASAGKRISRTFYSEDTNKKLDDLIRRTEEMIGKIPTP